MSRNEPVWLHHDELDRTISAVRSQVPELGSAGWYEVDPPEPETKAAGKDKPQAKAADKPKTPARRPSTKEHS